MGKPTPPSPPDYASAAVAQGKANVTSAEATNYLNQANQVGPNGSLTYSYDYAHGNKLPDGTIIPQTTATTALSPDQQKLYDQNMGISQALNGLAQKGVGYVADATSHPLTANQFNPVQTSIGEKPLQTSYDYSKAAALPGVNDFTKQRDDVTNALMSRMQPELDRARAARETQLANQGIGSGTQAYGTEQGYLGQRENDAHMQALLAGSQEQQRMFGDQMDLHNTGTTDARSQGDMYNQSQSQMFNQGLASGQFANTGQQQAIQEADYFKNQPLNMLNALRSGNQVSMPQFGSVSAGSQIAAAPVYAATNDQYQAQQNAYNTQMQGYGALMGGLGQLGGAAMHFIPGFQTSDRRLKKNIKKLGKTLSGLGIYSYNYISDSKPHFGYMADEVEKIYPDAVRYVDGFAQVNYARIG